MQSDGVIELGKLIGNQSLVLELWCEVLLAAQACPRKCASPAFEHSIDCIRRHSMAITVHASYSIALDGSAGTWKVDAELIRHAGGRAYLKVKPHESKLIRMVCCDCVDLPKNTRFTLYNTAGWRKLRELRNVAAFGSQTHRAGGLFGSAAKLPASWQRPKRTTAAKMQALREAAEPLEFELPGDDIVPNLVVASRKPAHPEDDIWVSLDGDTIMALVRSLRIGLTLDDLQSRRHYKTEDGCWRNGTAGRIKRLQQDSDAEDEAVPPKKYQSLNKAGRSEHCVLQDASEPESVGAAQHQACVASEGDVASGSEQLDVLEPVSGSASA